MPRKVRLHRLRSRIGGIDPQLKRYENHVIAALELEQRRRVEWEQWSSFKAWGRPMSVPGPGVGKW